MSFFGLKSKDTTAVIQNTIPVPVSFYETVKSEITKTQKLVRQHGNVLPVESTLILMKILDDITRLNVHMQDTDPTREEKIAVEFMINDYLPKTVKAFLMSHDDKERKESSFLEQVKILHGRVTSMVESVYAHDSAELEINGRFLAQKFG